MSDSSMMPAAGRRRSHGSVSVGAADKPAEETGPDIDDDAAPTMQVVGALVRQLRADAQLSLSSLAGSAGLSPGLLSQIERGIGNPSFSTLIKLAQALGVPVGSFFVSERPAGALARKGEHPRLLVADDSLVYELLTQHIQGRLGMVRAVIPGGRGTESSPFVHEGEECLFILEGELVNSVGGSQYRLYEGDSLTFDSSLPHWFRNDTDSNAVVISAMTPPSF